MSEWGIFEEECFEFLSKTYGSVSVKFEKSGMSDSTAPDVKVFINGVNTFNIETKMSSAQCGQFVLIPDDINKLFNFSSQNKYPENEYSNKMKELMNKDFIGYMKAGTAGKKLEMEESIFYSWIKGYYAKKNVKFFITKSTGYVIIPIEKFEQYFDVSTTYRMKKSGSSEPSKDNYAEIKELLNKSGVDVNLENKGKKLFIVSKRDIGELKLYGVNYNYKLAKKDDYKFEVRRLSNTCNSNVIFSIKLKKGQDEQDIQLLKKVLI